MMCWKLAFLVSFVVNADDVVVHVVLDVVVISVVVIVVVSR